MGLSWIFRRSNFSDIPEGGSVAALRFRRVLNCEFRPAGSWACTALPLYIHALAVVIEHRGFMAASPPNKNDGAPPSTVLNRRSCAFGLPLVSNHASGSLFRLLAAFPCGAWQEPEVLAPPSCRSMLFLGQQGPCASLLSPCRPASSSACLRACEHCALQLTAAPPPCRNDGAPPHTPAGT